MNKEEKFIDYLGKLKNEGNAELLENVISGFKTLVEYRVGGSVTERQVDIMESEDDMVDDVMIEDSDEENMLGDLDTPLDENAEVLGKIFGKNSDKARHAKYMEDQKKKVKEGITAAGDKNRAAFAELMQEDSDGGVSEENNPMMEVGEGEIKGKVTPAILRQIDDEIEGNIRKLAAMIDRQKLVSSEEQKVKYLNHMRGEKWREALLSRDIDPSSVKGLIPAVTESIEEADVALLESVAIMKNVVDKG